jgi:glycosyltransferase involved in cell wall biosynthesis
MSFIQAIFFGGTTSRADGFPELQALASAGYKIDIPANGLPRNEYLERMAGAWLAWSPSGYGWDCYRHYEAAAVGTVALSNYPTIYRDKPFREGEHCLFYSPEPGELTLAIKSALADRHRLRRMGKAAREHFFQNHTERARAERIAVMAVNRRLDGSLV